jgi:CO/xanthine dehydrogenase FAD-binding subunit
MAWYRPHNLDEALKILDSEKPKIVCGGTDLFVDWPTRQHESDTNEWMDIQNLPELRHIESKSEGMEIGAAVTAAEIWGNPLFLQVPALQQAARVIGGWQIQNRASIGGNIANASPAADLVVPLVAYRAHLKLSSMEGSRSLPVIDFITAPKSTQIEETEIITSIFIPNEVLGVPQTFLRHDQRGGTDISLVSVAAIVSGTHDYLHWIQIAVGAANYKPVILPDLNQQINGKLTDEQLDHIADLYADNCNPITDVRASAEYRREMVKVFVKRAISEILNTQL